MHRLVCFNGRITETGNAEVRAVSAAALYGKGVFTTIRIAQNAPLWLEKHFLRLRLHAQHIGINAHQFPNENLLLDSIKNLIEQNSCAEGKMRLTLFDENSSGIWHDENFVFQNSSSFLITTAPLEAQRATYRLTTADFPIHSRAFLSGIKSCNYLPNICALAAAKKKGFDECLIFNETGHLVSASTANIFLEKNGNIFTPPLTDGCLDGTTRQFVIDICRRHSVSVTEKQITSADLEGSFVFLTSNGIGLKQVSDFENLLLISEKSSIFELLESSYAQTLADCRF